MNTVVSTYYRTTHNGEQNARNQKSKNKMK